jgi:Flp pilus assembly protein TadG
MAIRLFSHYYTRSLRADQSGATIVLVAIMLPLLITVMAVTVDVARLYVVQSKAQSALDTALLGAVASQTTIADIRNDADALFNANLTPGYMGSTKLGAVTVNQAGAGVYNGAVTVRVPTSLLNIAGSGLTTFNLTAQVTSGLQSAAQNVEISLVIDNSRHITGTEMLAIRSAATGMVNTIFSSSNTLPNVRISVVPYNVSVNIGRGRASWVQPSLDNLLIYLLYNLFGEYGFLSNRDKDSPPNGYVDYTDAPPIANAAKFRLPQDDRTWTFGRDLQYVPIPEIAFAMNNKNDIINELNRSVNGSDLRINVGLMWGWFTLSPNWQGVWSGSLPTLPGNYSASLSKTLVLVVGDRNNVFLGVNGTSNDDRKTEEFCARIKGAGITLHVIAFSIGNSDLLESQLSSCASPGHYYRARNQNQLNAAFNTVYSGVNASTVRLTQ